jgi:N-hydroxyarylamine O-acetyltransferase
MWNAPEGVVRPRTHMLLRPQCLRASTLRIWVYGLLTLTAPLLLESDIEQRTPHG